LNIEHISVSRSETFHQCNFLYKLKYHLKLPSPYAEPMYFFYGKLVHRCAQEYVVHKAEKPLNEIVIELLSGKIPIEERFGKKVYATPLPQEYKNRLPGHLRSIERITKLLGVTGMTEFVFEYDLDPPNKKLLNGVIDRLIEKGNKYWIVDYKTTKAGGGWRKTPQTISKDLQLRCYARVIQRKNNAPAENIQAALFYLEGGDLISTKFSEQSLVSVEQELLKTYKQIENMDPINAKGNVGDHCRRCNYRTLCPYFKK